MARVNSLLVMGGAGYSGSYLYNNRDLLDEIMQNGVKGAINYYTSPSKSLSNGNLEAFNSLRNEIAELKQAQRSGHNALIIAHQPSTVLGFPMWKAVGLVGTVGFIYFKVKGYEMRDLVHVSKKHFTTVTESLRQQFDVMQQVLGAVKTDLIERVHVVETKLVETREAIEALIGFRFGNVEKKVDDLSSELNNTNAQLTVNTMRLDQISGDLVDVKSNISAVGAELDGRISEVQSKVGELRESSNDNFQKISFETNNLDRKIERFSDQTTSQIISIQSGLEESQKGISLLCQYVSSQSPESSATSVSNLQSYVQSGPFKYSQFSDFSRRSFAASNSRQLISLKL